MSLWQWSTTPANNATAGAIDWAEGQPPSTVNDSARQMMADVATWFAGPEWLNYGLTPTYVSATQFTVTGNQTGIFSVGRRVKAMVSAGAVYGTITASAFTSLTTVTVALDSGNLDSGVSEVDVGFMNPVNPSLPVLTNLAPGPSWTSVNWKRTLKIPSINAIEFAGGASNNFGMGNSGGVLYIFNTPDEGSSSVAPYVVTIDGSGNLTASGNITAFSDERLKTDWKPVASDFLEKLSTIKSGTFRRTDIGEIQAGVSAQDLQKVLPEAVGGAAILSVAYGQAALVACVELAKEVLRLRALLEPVK